MYSVYTMFNKEMQPMYVGCTNNLKSRVKQHKHTNKRNYFYIEWCNFTDKLRAIEMEKKLIIELKPTLNKSVGGYPVKDKAPYKTIRTILKERRLQQQNKPK